MKRIGFLIPEFPGQTHAFFMRERHELERLGVETDIISTRVPLASGGAATHDWAEDAARKTSYLFPAGIGTILKCVFEIVRAGPASWLRCIQRIAGKSDLPLTKRPMLLAWMVAGAYLKRICRQKNLFHVHVHSCANSAHIAMFANMLNGPSYSLTLHGPMQDYGLNQATKWQYAAFGIVITRELYTEINDALKDTPLPPIFLAPMGVNVREFTRAAEYQPARRGDVVKLVSCGRIHPAKAHDDLIRAVALLKNAGVSAELRICGTTDVQSNGQGYMEELHSLCQELGVESQVNFLGSVSELRVKQELESADIFCLASLKEPLGVAIMEAMAMEIPAVVARSPGVLEMIDDGIDGMLVSPRAPDEFAEAIVQLLDNPGTASRIAHAGRRKVEDNFHSGISASKIAQGLEL